MSEQVCSEFIDTGRCSHSDAEHDAMSEQQQPTLDQFLARYMNNLYGNRDRVAKNLRDEWLPQVRTQTRAEALEEAARAIEDAGEMYGHVTSTKGTARIVRDLKSGEPT